MKMGANVSRQGSVLMETVLVLPLLLLVLGGMLMMGDILHGRLHLLTIDRVAAWSPESRFETGRGDIFKSWFRHLERHTALHLEKGFMDFYDEGAARHIVDPGYYIDKSWMKRSSPKGTEWLDFAGGRANARVEVPMWAAMANTHSVVFQQGDYLSADWRLMTYESDVDDRSNDKACHGAGDFKENDRQYVVRRKSDSALVPDGDGLMSPDYRRTLPNAVPLLDTVSSRGKSLDWTGIAMGDWPCDPSTTTDFGIISFIRAQFRSPFSRHPSALAVGE